MSSRQNFKPLFRRLLVFTMPIRRKLEGSSLYLGHEKRGTFSTSQEAWVIAASDKCKTKWTRGTKVWVADGFEFDDFPHQIWDECEDEAVFCDLRSMQQAVDGVVVTSVITEDSILAYAGEDLD